MTFHSDNHGYGFEPSHIKSFLASHGIDLDIQESPCATAKEARPAAPEVVAESDIDPADLPEELHIANIAFRAVTNDRGDPKVTFRNRLISYLKTNFPDLSREAVKRVATVANPDKAPGRKNFNAE